MVMDLDTDVDTPFRRRQAPPELRVPHCGYSSLEGQSIDAKVVVIGNSGNVSNLISLYSHRYIFLP